MGGARPAGALSGGWNWWTLVGAIYLFLLLLTLRRQPALPVAIVLAAFGGLLIGDLTQIMGVVPVWATLLLFTLSRNVWGGRRHRQV